MVIPMNESHTGMDMSQEVNGVLYALGGEMWTDKLFLVATDSERNMTGRLQGAVSRF